MDHMVKKLVEAAQFASDVYFDGDSLDDQRAAMLRLKAALAEFSKEQFQKPLPLSCPPKPELPCRHTHVEGKDFGDKRFLCCVKCDEPLYEIPKL